MTKSLKLPDYNPYNEFERRINPILPNIDTNWNPPLIEGYVRLLSECKTFVIDLPKDCELITEFLVEECTLDV